MCMKFVAQMVNSESDEVRMSLQITELWVKG